MSVAKTVLKTIAGGAAIALAIEVLWHAPDFVQGILVGAIATFLILVAISSSMSPPRP